ncbi:MAG: ribonuclease HII [Parcubacteria group bacterium]
MRYIVGIDEAGRGPLAGPVAVGVVVVKSDLPREFWKGIRDSKKLTLKAREAWYKKARLAKSEGLIDFAVALVSEKVIDTKGIVYAIDFGVKGCLLKLKLIPEETQVFLDGSLKAPKEYINQKTIIKGDDKIPVISLASILAKVTRDKKMVTLAEHYPDFGLEKHKGYGTKAHIEKISTLGPTSCHRRSFLKNLQSDPKYVIIKK